MIEDLPTEKYFFPKILIFFTLTCNKKKILAKKIENQAS